MTGDPRTPQSTGPTAHRPTTGFMIIEDMLTEFGKTGRCEMLDRWVEEARRQMAESREQAIGDRARNQADCIQGAYQAANELVCGIHGGKIKRP